MNKLLKVTLITAIMATSGMCGGGNKPECQGHMPYQTPAYMMPVPSYGMYQAPMKICPANSGECCRSNCAALSIAIPIGAIGWIISLRSAGAGIPGIKDIICSAVMSAIDPIVSTALRISTEKTMECCQDCCKYY